MTTRTEQLKKLMKDHYLSIEKVAEILDRKPQTVRVWRCSDSREIPAHSLELLKSKIAQQ